MVVYHVLWFMHHDPLAHSRLSLESSKSKKKGQNKASFNRKKQSKSFGFGVTAFGGLLEYSCKPNLRRVYVSGKGDRKGKILYKANCELQPGTKLTIGWGQPRYWFGILSKQGKVPTGGNEFSQYLKVKFGIEHQCENCPKPGASRASSVGTNRANSATTSVTSANVTSANSATSANATPSTSAQTSSGTPLSDASPSSS